MTTASEPLVVEVDAASLAMLLSSHPDVQAREDVRAELYEDASECDPRPLVSAGLLRGADGAWELTADGAEVLEIMATAAPEVSVHVVFGGYTRADDASGDDASADEDEDMTASEPPQLVMHLYGAAERSVELSSSGGAWRLERFATDELGDRILEATGLIEWTLGWTAEPGTEITVTCTIVAPHDDGTIAGGATAWVYRGDELLAVGFDASGQPTGTLDPVTVDELIAELGSFLDVALPETG